jgi:hypothetical protein
MTQIAEIRQQMAHSQMFRGYRAATVACSGVLGGVGALAQAIWIAAPQQELGRYLGLWIGLALISLVVVGVELFWHVRRSASVLAQQMTMLAVRQFLPSIVTGALLTFCIYANAPDVAWMLPGLWSLLFGLGVFASYRLLPRQVFWVGVHYLSCGTACLLWGRDGNELAPIQMAICFGGGQLLAAAVLYWTLER